MIFPLFLNQENLAKYTNTETFPPSSNGHAGFDYLFSVLAAVSLPICPVIIFIHRLNRFLNRSKKRNVRMLHVSDENRLIIIFRIHLLILGRCRCRYRLNRPRVCMVFSDRTSTPFLVWKLPFVISTSLSLGCFSSC